MAWTTTADPEAFLAAAGAFLRAAPAANTVTLTAVETMRERGPSARGDEEPLLGWWQAAGEPVTGSFMLTPPYPLHVGAMPPAAVDALVELLAGRADPPRGVNGDATAAEAFAAAWSARTGVRAHVHRRMRLHRLDALVEPDPPPPGRAVVGDVAHRDLIVAWYEAFAAEIEEPQPADVRPQVDERISHGGATLWVVEDEPVSLAGTTRCVAGMVRIAPVYTPPERRGRGYGGAATAAATRRAIEAGAEEVLLFTDLANPTSNRLYARLGYRPVEDSAAFAFDG
jgi:RimJ/RimL family protein N-acetyltransferase